NENLELLEEELYKGIIKTDKELLHRAKDLGINIYIRDDKKKVRIYKENVLVGEVTSYSAEKIQIRRMYVTIGGYSIAEIIDNKLKITDTGGSSFIVFGNEITKKIANIAIKNTWKKRGTLKDAIRVLITAMEAASKKTASVSKQYDIILIS
ncbi:MAG: DUF2121 domain-containing protein, partial [Methanosarcinales archaeon]